MVSHDVNLVKIQTRNGGIYAIYHSVHICVNRDVDICSSLLSRVPSDVYYMLSRYIKL